MHQRITCQSGSVHYYSYYYRDCHLLRVCERSIEHCRQTGTQKLLAPHRNKQLRVFMAQQAILLTPEIIVPPSFHSRKRNERISSD